MEKWAGNPHPKAAGKEPRQWGNQWGFQSCCVGIGWGMDWRHPLKGQQTLEKLERAKGFEPSTPTLAKRNKLLRHCSRIYEI
jgi:hypothetical protein